MPASLHRPDPIATLDATPIDATTPPRAAAQRMMEGETLVVTDHHRTGVRILEALVAKLRPPRDTSDHLAKQRYRDRYRTVAWRLLVPVVGGRLGIPGGPPNGYLGELYRDLDRFWLPLPEVRDLANAWHRYDEGVPMAVLGHPLHPFYGTYLPKRTLHLELFGTWLSSWSGGLGHAVDVGTGSGVLALMLARKGFGRVTATDRNANACESVRRELARLPVPPPVLVRQTDLLTGVEGPVDLIVFNPPWTQGPVDNLLDMALHYDDDLFERFFDQADAVLAPEGRIVLVFSNLLRLVQPDVPHPVDLELERGRFRLDERLTRRVKPEPGTATARRTKERVEVWSLARA